MQENRDVESCFAQEEKSGEEADGEGALAELEAGEEAAGHFFDIDDADAQVIETIGEPEAVEEAEEEEDDEGSAGGCAGGAVAPGHEGDGEGDGDLDESDAEVDFIVDGKPEG